MEKSSYSKGGGEGQVAVAVGFADSQADPMELRNDLDAVLAAKGLLYARDLEESVRDDLRASWKRLARARGGSLSSADITDTIRSYLRIGLVRRPPLAGQDEEESLRRTLPEEAASYLAANVPTRPVGAEGPWPTIVSLAPTRGSTFAAPPSAGQASATSSRTTRRAVYGSFSNEFDTCAFESQDEEGRISVFPVVCIDQRFAKLVAMLAQDHIALVLLGEMAQNSREESASFGTPAPPEKVFQVWGMHAISELPKGDAQKVMDADLLEVMLQRLRTLPEPTAVPKSKAKRSPTTRPRVRLTSVDDMASYLACMEDTLPPNIRIWAYQNLEIARNDRASKEERRHATRSLSLMLSIQWGRAPFKRVDPARARAILDQQLFGLDSVKQRVIETIVQINRTHTLPLYGLLLAGPAGVGKSQIAYATARILNLPWASLDMSAIRDLAALTGSDRVYSNAKPGRVMEALEQAGSANMVLVINELDKADEGGQNGSSADALLTLFDNLGFTDNYIACAVPTDGIYPIATANDLSKIDAPLLSRFEVIEIPDYSPDQKRVILQGYSLPKVLAHMGLRGEEFRLTDDGLNSVIERYRDEPGCRSLEKAAEHLAAHALFLLESDPSLDHITFDAAQVQQILDS